MGIHVMVLGGKGVGKSTITNQLLGLSGQNAERFPQRNDPEEAMGSQYLRTGCTEEGINLEFHIVEVPGIHVETEDSYRRNWSDIIHAFELLRNKVNVFLLVLNFMETAQSESVARAFVNLFGWSAGIHAMVVFTNNRHEDWLIDRSIQFYHESLSGILKGSFPYSLVPHDDVPRLPILQKLRDISQIQEYNRSSFMDAQIIELEKWAKKLRGKGVGVKKTLLGYQVDGLPETLLLFGRYYSEEQLQQFVGLLG